MWINILAIVLKEVLLKLIIELWELHNYFALAPDKIEIKREMLSDLYNVPISNVKKSVH